MAYFNFQKITPPAPNDPTVNEVTQLNNNWNDLDTKLQPYLIGGTLTLAEAGQEYFDANFRYTVWDGVSVSRVPEDIDAAWSAWTALPMLSPRAIRPSFTPRWRSNSALRMVELSGGVQFNAAADVWTMGSAFQLNQLASGSPPSSLQPIGGLHRSQCAAALTAGTSVVAAGRISCEVDTGFVKISAQYMGSGGGGNFLMLDQVWWWY